MSMRRRAPRRWRGIVVVVVLLAMVAGAACGTRRTRADLLAVEMDQSAPVSGPTSSGPQAASAASPGSGTPPAATVQPIALGQPVVGSGASVVPTSASSPQTTTCAGQ